jgi:hypothetical protein
MLQGATLVARTRTSSREPREIDVRLRTEDDLHYHLGLTVVGPIGETELRGRPSTDCFAYPRLDVRGTVASVCVLEGYLSCGPSLENYDLRINE